MTSTTTTPAAAGTQSAYASASLYVGDLAPEVTEGQLFDAFRNIGPVASIRVCRDAVTKRSLGYAYINFHNPADAERAIDTLNFTPIMNVPIRIMWSQRDPAKRKSGVGNIFIKNLHKTITNAALQDTFSAFGNIVSCKVELDQNGVSKGYGYVNFETQEEADQAIAKVNGMQIAGKIVFVGPFQARKARGQDSSSAAFTNVYVKNLDSSVTKEQIDEMFGAHGKVTSSAIMTNDKDESKGFAFVNFETPEQATAAVEKLNGTVINGKPVYVGRAQKKAERDELLRHQRVEQMQKFQGTNVYVKNLDDNVDDEKLKQEFNRFGPISSVRVMADEKGNSRGFGFISFNNAEDATRAINEMNGVIFGTKPLYAGLAQRKDVRRSQLAALHQQKLNMMQMNMGMPMNMRGPGMVYPGAPPVYYPQMGVPQGRMPAGGPYPPQMMPRGRFPGQPGPAPNGAPQAQGQPTNMARGGPQGPGMAPGGAPAGRGGRRGAHNPRAPPSQPQGAGRGGKPQNAQGQVNRSYKYTTTARNQPGAPDAQPEAEPEMSKQMMGEQLYPLIVKSQPELAGKITGMLLESFEMRELSGLIQNPSLLESKINEAITVLQQAQQEQPAEVSV